jgi:hypothetical protein
MYCKAKATYIPTTEPVRGLALLPGTGLPEFSGFNAPVFGSKEYALVPSLAVANR